MKIKVKIAKKKCRSGGKLRYALFGDWRIHVRICRERRCRVVIRCPKRAVKVTLCRR